MSDQDTRTRLTWFDLSALTGISVRSLRAIKYRADKNRKLAAETGDPSVIKPGDLPEPDGYQPAKGRQGRPAPYWHPETVSEWITHKRAAKR